MRIAAERFDTAGGSVHAALQASTDMVSALRASSSEVSGTTRDLAAIVADYRTSRDVAAQNIQTLQSVVETAQQEAGLRQQAVGDLMRLSDQIQRLNAETNEYLAQVSLVVGRSFDEFGNGIERTLQKTIGSLDAELDKAVRSLAGGVQEVGEKIDDLSDVLGKAIPRAVKA
jgi:DNA-binding transcriptional regulator YbjK